MTEYKYTSFIIPNSRIKETGAALERDLADMGRADWTLAHYSTAVLTDQNVTGDNRHSVIHSFIWAKD
jgi:hypothetical protein